MEHEMKISPSAVRHLRLSRGWSQDQLAMVSGVSLRTVQRVEAEGIASINTAVSLAATFEVKLIELQEGTSESYQKETKTQYSGAFFGIAVLTLAGLGESSRISSLPMTGFFAAMNILCALIGIFLAAPAFLHSWQRREYPVGVLLLLGVPLVTLLAVGGIFSLVSGRLPNWNLAIFGASGVIFIAMALRELKRRNGGAGA